MFKKVLTMSVLAMLFYGCSYNTVSLNSNNIAQLRGKTISYVEKTNPVHPYVKTPGKDLGAGVGGAIGGLIMSFSDTKYAHGLDVPSNIMGLNIANELASRYGMSYTASQTSDYSVDVDTTWQVKYFDLHWGTYKVILNTNVRVRNRESKKTVTQISCKYDPKYSKGMPSYDEIMANNGAVIVSETKRAMDICMNKARQEILK